MLYIYLVFGSVHYLPIRDETNVLFIRRIWTGKSKTLKILQNGIPGNKKSTNIETFLNKLSNKSKLKEIMGKHSLSSKGLPLSQAQSISNLCNQKLLFELI